MLHGSKNYFPEFKTIYALWFKKLLSRMENKFMLIKKTGVQSCKQVTWHTENTTTQGNGVKVKEHSSEKCLIINKTQTYTMRNDPGHRCNLTNTHTHTHTHTKTTHTHWVQNQHNFNNFKNHMKKKLNKQEASLRHVYSLMLR